MRVKNYFQNNQINNFTESSGTGRILVIEAASHRDFCTQVKINQTSKSSGLGRILVIEAATRRDFCSQWQIGLRGQAYAVNQLQHEID